jgi:hypothetical protein
LQLANFCLSRLVRSIVFGFSVLFKGSWWLKKQNDNHLALLLAPSSSKPLANCSLLSCEELPPYRPSPSTLVMSCKPFSLLLLVSPTIDILIDTALTNSNRMKNYLALTILGIIALF